MKRLAKSRIKLGLLLNEYGEKNNLKVSEEEVKTEIEKQIKECQDKKKWFLNIIKKTKRFSKFKRFSL